MHRRKKPPTGKLLERAVPRRTALKGLGALAVSLPVLGSASCSEDKKTASSTTAPPAFDSNGAAGAGAGNGLGAAPGQTAGASNSPGSNSAGSPASGAGGTNANPTSGPAGTGGSSVQATGTGGGAATGTGGAGAGTGGTGGAPSTGGGDFVTVMFDNVASCTLTPTDPAGEGPFFIHEDEVMNDESLIRSDMREGKPGVELQLNLRVLDSDAGCMTPISGVQVYVWHTDATGYYSGFANQNPDMPYSGAIERTVENADRFCRGVQVTDKDGVVRFRTLFPGWYNGRAIHIHFVALRPGSGPATTSYRSAQYMVFTTQMYFEEQFSRMIHEHNAPYMSRATGAAYAMYVKPQNMVVMPTMKMQGDVAVGALNVVTAASGSRR